ncbi:MAG TPA: XdhC/CoxI family protein [Acidobacteriota bacterium]
MRLQRNGEPAVLVTVIEALGSTPQGLGAKMLVYPDGRSLGTIGGGCMEAEILEHARAVLQSGIPLKVRVRLTPDPISGRDAICGGVVEVFVEPVCGRPRIVILGAGHIGQALASVASVAGYRVALADDRIRYANQERFPGADEIVVDDFEAALKRLEPKPSDYVVIVTRGHEHDKDCLRAALQAPVAYVGMIGSKTKVVKTLKALRAEGVDQAVLRRVHAPIGLDLGAESPGEIAISILAEIMACRRGRDAARIRSMSQRATEADSIPS